MKIKNIKINLLTVGIVVATMVGCSKSETDELDPNTKTPISFRTNVSTKAGEGVTTENIGSNFYVFGNYGAYGADGKKHYTHQLYHNEISTTDYYWANDNDNPQYVFAAYADGINGKIANTVVNGQPCVQFNADDSLLVFSDYHADGKDLVAAVQSVEEQPDFHNAVPLTFKHLLSQLTFTFISEDDPALFDIRVSNISIVGAANKGTCEFTEKRTSWAPAPERPDYELGNITGNFAGKTKTLAPLFVIPQMVSLIDGQKITIDFNIRTRNNSTTVSKDDPKRLVLTAPAVPGIATSGNQYMPGARYHYTITLAKNQVATNINVSILPWKDNIKTEEW